MRTSKLCQTSIIPQPTILFEISNFIFLMGPNFQHTCYLLSFIKFHQRVVNRQTDNSSQRLLWFPLYIVQKYIYKGELQTKKKGQPINNQSSSYQEYFTKFDESKNVKGIQRQNTFWNKISKLYWYNFSSFFVKWNTSPKHSYFFISILDQE